MAREGAQRKPTLRGGHRRSRGHRPRRDAPPELEQYRSVEALVSLMARHQLRNHQRRKPSEALDEAMIVSLTTSPQEVLEMKEDDKWLSEKLQQLPTTQRTLLYMRQVERRSHEEIATLLGIETTSVSTLLARARRTLLEEIKRRNQI